MSKIEALRVADQEYPRLLQEIHDPPATLYLKGQRTCLENPAIAIVGSRRATRYGQRQAEFFAGGLARLGFVIISGLAYGVDSWAHLAAIEQGVSVAVIAGGLATPLMSWQQKIAKRIIRGGGAIVSEQPLKKPALKYHFPKRNRIIAGLAYATLVIEAKAKSGALITANAAANYNRQVFSVPGDLDRMTSAGSNNLIRDGAILVREPRDILKEIQDQLPAWEQKQLKIKSKFRLTERIAALLEHKPLSTAALAQELNISPRKVLEAITKLEINGQLNKQNNGLLMLKQD